MRDGSPVSAHVTRAMRLGMALLGVLAALPLGDGAVYFGWPVLTAIEAVPAVSGAAEYLVQR